MGFESPSRPTHAIRDPGSTRATIDASGAQPADSAQAASAPVRFVSDQPMEFPTAAAALMAALAIAVALSWWWRLRGLGRRRWMASLPSSMDRELDVRVQRRLRLDARTSLYAIRWRDRELLIATGYPGGPVVLDRCEPRAIPEGPLP